jgi:hypothetical protein
MDAGNPANLADAIVNFAAATHVDRSLIEPEEFLPTDGGRYFPNSLNRPML